MQQSIQFVRHVVLNKHFKRDTVISYCANAIVLGTSFLLMIMINHDAGVKSYGEIALVSSLSSLIATFISPKSIDAVTRFYIREKISQQRENAKLIMVIAFGIDMIASGILLGIFFGLSETIAIIFFEASELSLIVLTYGYISVSLLMRSSISGYLQSHELFGTINFFQIVDAGLKLVFVGISLYSFENNTTQAIVDSYALAAVTTTVLMAVIFFYYFKKEFSLVSLKYNAALIKEYLLFNGKTFFATSIASINNNIDTIMLGYFTNTTVVGIYQSLKNLLMPISFVSSPYAMLTTAQLTRFYSNQDKINFMGTLAKVTKVIVLFNVIIIAIMLLGLEYLLNVIGIDEVLRFEYVMLAIIVTIKQSIWWNPIVINFYNPLFIGVLAIVYGMFFQMTVWFLYFSVSSFQMIHIIIPNLIATISVSFLAYRCLQRLVQRDMS